MSSRMAPLSFIFSWLLLLANSVAMAIPLGTPPVAADPLMLQVVPEECLYFVNWSGLAKANSASLNGTERLLAEPEIQQFGTEVLQTLRKTMMQFAGQSPSPEAKVVAEIVPTLVEKILQGPGSLYLGKAELAPTGLAVDASFIHRVQQYTLLRLWQNSTSSAVIAAPRAPRSTYRPWPPPDWLWGRVLCWRWYLFRFV